MPVGSIPDDDNLPLELFADGGTTQILELNVFERISAWR